MLGVHRAAGAAHAHEPRCASFSPITTPGGKNLITLLSRTRDFGKPAASFCSFSPKPLSTFSPEPVKFGSEKEASWGVPTTDAESRSDVYAALTFTDLNVVAHQGCKSRLAFLGIWARVSNNVGLMVRVSGFASCG